MSLILLSLSSLNFKIDRLDMAFLLYLILVYLCSNSPYFIHLVELINCFRLINHLDDHRIADYR